MIDKDDTDLSDDKAESFSSHSSNLQSRIADTLGISAADFHHRSPLGYGTEDAGHDGQEAEMALTHDCLDLIEAFVRVADQEERQLLLKMVRDAAQMNTTATAIQKEASEQTLLRLSGGESFENRGFLRYF